jgi:hypothetical protein
MHKLLRSAVLGIIGFAVALAPALGQEQQAEDLSKYVGAYTVEIPDYGVMEIAIAIADEGGLTLTAIGATTPLKHLSGSAYELDTPDFGIINIGFIAEDDGSISALTINGYDFSFVAIKKNQ